MFIQVGRPPSSIPWKLRSIHHSTQPKASWFGISISTRPRGIRPASTHPRRRSAPQNRTTGGMRRTTAVSVTRTWHRTPLGMGGSPSNRRARSWGRKALPCWSRARSCKGPPCFFWGRVSFFLKPVPGCSFVVSNSMGPKIPWSLDS